MQFQRRIGREIRGIRRDRFRQAVEFFQRRAQRGPRERRAGGIFLQRRELHQIRGRSQRGGKITRAEFHLIQQLRPLPCEFRRQS